MEKFRRGCRSPSGPLTVLGQLFSEGAFQVLLGSLSWVLWPPSKG